MALIVGGLVAWFLLPRPWFAAVVVLLAAWEAFGLWTWISSRRRRKVAGIESMVGERGTLVAPDRVRLRGTSYPARVVEGSPGDPVVVEAVEGMTLVVRRDAGS